MSRKKPAHGGKPAMDLIEEATQLVLRAPASVLAAYYLGAIPALLGMLYFFSDMTRSPFARMRLLEAALVVALLYIWMKCWQSVFAAGLHAALQGESAGRWDVARISRMLHVQAAVQPSGLFARLLSAQIIIPYVWVYSFYQNVGVIGEGKKLSVVLSEAARQARLWPRQAHYAIGLLLCFALVIALNIGVALFVAPQLLKMLFGIETEFSKSPMSLLNTTVFATVAACTYLAFDPVRKAVFVVRCFYGGALKSGRDLRVQVRQMRGRAARTACDHGASAGTANDRRTVRRSIGRCRMGAVKVGVGWGVSAPCPAHRRRPWPARRSPAWRRRRASGCCRRCRARCRCRQSPASSIA